MPKVVDTHVAEDEKLRRINHLMDFLEAHHIDLSNDYHHGSSVVAVDVVELARAIIQDETVEWDTSNSLLQVFYKEDLDKTDSLWDYIEDGTDDD
jgi:sugar phosphate isomerase/epimerase